MRKLIIICLIVIFSIMVACPSVLGSSTYSPSTLLNMYLVENSLALGLQKRLLGNFYGTANIEYLNSVNDLQLQGGAAYYIPGEALFLKFYVGAGAHFSRDRKGYQYPYFQVGTRFLFCFAEALYPWAREKKPEYRLGLSLNFSPKVVKSSSQEVVEDKPILMEDKSIQNDFDLPPIIKLIKIENEFGEVEVKTGVSGVVSVAADIEMSSSQKNALTTYRNDLKVIGESVGDTFKIKIHHPRLKNGLQIPKLSVKMVIYVPSGINVEINGKAVTPSEI